LYVNGKSRLKDIDQPALEAKILLLKAASISEEEFYAGSDRRLSPVQKKLYYRLISSRLDGFPLAYLIGEKEFWSIPFRVFPGVLIPRPETELVVDSVIKVSSRREEIIVEIGTGCGNIAVSLAKELPLARIIASDISRKALKNARLNAAVQEISKITFVYGNLFAPLKKLNLKGKCGFIVSNPPYVSSIEWGTLQEEIIKHEPRKALVAGKTGLEVIRKLVKGSPAYLKSDGYLIFEIGHGQKDKIMEMFGSGWRDVKCFKDLQGIPRVISATIA